MVTHLENSHKEVCAIRTAAHYAHSVYACGLGEED